DIANTFKRTPIVDPMTGQLDLRKNILNVSEDFFIPVRSDTAPNPIETLASAQNLTAIDDIKFIQNKMLSALRIPKAFLNFQETAGEGKNLSLMDIRFSRTINRIQQYLLMELTRVCIIHLYIFGMEEELTNFSLTMHNPSEQMEMMELENLSKRIAIAKDAVVDNGNGIPLMSLKHACTTIMKMKEDEYEEMLNEIRLEKALAVELAKTHEIIKDKTGVFDSVDNIYGDPNAKYSEGLPETMAGGAGGAGGGMGMMGGEGGLPEGGEVGEDEFGEDQQGGMDMSMGDAMGEQPNGGLSNLGGSDSGVTENINLGELILNNKLNGLLKENMDNKVYRYITENKKRIIKKVKPTNDKLIINESITELVNDMKTSRENKTLNEKKMLQ
ncbi:MAG: hypothetical protein EZS28_022466, partial [Streblomastix strix]